MIGKVVEVVDYPSEDFRVVQVQGAALVEVTRVSPQRWSDGWCRWCVVLEQGHRPRVALV